ncbi:MAG: CDP-diacylglycerol--glycerol-3-phosphate 3-phosphatidyltransferase [Peptoniphilus harei]|uniref:CDP-diacylglycerol--glycerol-3-phosphate 3-phosphatidyltransferase n=1 Tax=uncultured Peptoniphilus sp. TaxID=254354 RepID=UPI0025830475|nr:CDP-diacylglycerol--glycerol-3-phosphate 3-phosphatidyltransferase [uncultured Peptoniphilus sp.]MDU6783027.1 CDP-diacylglycerol--glycerol-3-phosphate 3-phosphatidyltransferase [Peptoniphilus harei]MDU7114933.1 CDP-diacylglycerol--glycerol-3-phosphate 3-phosphatidyltransferase [Peptoniphilus harei]
MNTPNKLTLMRTLMVPIFVLCMYLDFNNSRIVATIIFAIASFTDFLDGYLARRDNLVTNFGKFADPLADKILVCSAMIMLVSSGEMPAWAVIIIIAREFTITGFRIIAASENITIAASPLGKFKTVTQLISNILLLTGLSNLRPIGMGIFYLAVVFTVISGADYLIKNKKVLDLENI